MRTDRELVVELLAVLCVDGFRDALGHLERAMKGKDWLTIRNRRCCASIRWMPPWIQARRFKRFVAQHVNSADGGCSDALEKINKFSIDEKRYRPAMDVPNGMNWDRAAGQDATEGYAQG